MARQDSGWVRLHRKLEDSDIGRNFLLMGLWSTLLRWANYRETRVEWKGIPRELKRGEVLTSETELAEYGGVDRKTVHRWILYLCNRGSISVEKSPRGSKLGMIITLLNYEKYNTSDAAGSHEPPQEDGHDGPMSLPTYKEIKKSKKEIREKAAEPLHPLIECWNKNCGDLPKVKKTNKARNRKAAERWSENSPDEWVEIITRVSKSNFCNGKNDRGWVAGFDWILQSEVHLKISEGKYDNREGTVVSLDTLELPDYPAKEGA